MTLDPARTYSAAEVQALLSRQTLEEMRVDLGEVMKLARETAESAKVLAGELRELKDIVKSHVQLPSHPGTAQELAALETWRHETATADQELGIGSMSQAERAALPGAVRAYLAGQESLRHRERTWRRIATAAIVAGATLSILSAFGLVSWVRIHIFHLPYAP